MKQSSVVALDDFAHYFMDLVNRVSVFVKCSGRGKPSSDCKSAASGSRVQQRTPCLMWSGSLARSLVRLRHIAARYGPRQYSFQRLESVCISAGDEGHHDCRMLVIDIVLEHVCRLRYIHMHHHSKETFASMVLATGQVDLVRRKSAYEFHRHIEINEPTRTCTCALAGRVTSVLSPKVKVPHTTEKKKNYVVRLPVSENAILHIYCAKGEPSVSAQRNRR